MRLSRLLLAVGGSLIGFGAYLIGPWAIGVVLVLVGVAFVVHGLLRDVPERMPGPAGSIEAVLEKARRAS